MRSCDQYEHDNDLHLIRMVDQIGERVCKTRQSSKLDNVFSILPVLWHNLSTYVLTCNRADASLEGDESRCNGCLRVMSFANWSI